MELPKKKVKATTKSPTTLLLYSAPKVGKTTTIAQLEDCLIIDFEEGTKFVDSLHVRANNAAELQQILIALKKEKSATGKNPYKYLALDTATRLEEIAEEIGVELYKGSSMGKKFDGGPMELKALPMGAGYGYIRNAYKILLNSFSNLCDRLILIGHTKDKYITKDDKEVIANDIDLSGKLAGIVTQKMDAIGYLTRKKNKVFVSFKTDGETTTGNRSKHLSGKEILLSEEDENGNLVPHWDQIFID